MRVQGWEVRLAEEVEAAKGLKFVRGKADCATWAFDVVMALTGTDPAVAYRKSYRTLAGANRLMKQKGWSDLTMAATEIMGAPAVAALAAQRGDLLVARDEMAFGICVGAQGAFMGPDGLVFLTLRACAGAWRV